MNMSEGMKESLRCFEVFKGVKYPIYGKMLINWYDLE